MCVWGAGGSAWSWENTWDSRLVSEPSVVTCSGGGGRRGDGHAIDNSNNNQGVSDCSYSGFWGCDNS